MSDILTNLGWGQCIRCGILLFRLPSCIVRRHQPGSNQMPHTYST